MRSEEISFYSEGAKIIGTLHPPDVGDQARAPVIVQGPGWLEKACSPISERFHESFVAGGYAVLQFDYRGFGKSEGEQGWIRPDDQIADIINALAFVETRQDLDPARIGLFGSGGTGGGNAIYVAANDDRVKTVILDNAVADGADWLRRMRRDYEWNEFRERVNHDQRARVIENKGELVDPTDELMVSTPERKAAGMPTFGRSIHLASAQYLQRYKPIDVVHRIAPRPLLIVCVANDPVIPEEHAWAIYERAGKPKRIIRQVGVGHYEAYRENHEAIAAEFIAWLDRYLVGKSIVVQADE
ncbi:MAG: alpha/beta hydrolase family protein [Anaerolineales bacterium]